MTNESQTRSEEMQAKALRLAMDYTAISGLLMRRGWLVFQQQLADAIGDKGIVLDKRKD